MKTTKWSWDRQPSRKWIQNNGGEDELGSWANNGAGERAVYQRPTRTKEQTEMDITLVETNSRITEAEEWTNDSEDRMVEITVGEKNIQKRMKQTNKEKWRQPKKPLG